MFPGIPRWSIWQCTQGVHDEKRGMACLNKISQEKGNEWNENTRSIEKTTEYVS